MPVYPCRHKYHFHYPVFPGFFVILKIKTCSLSRGARGGHRLRLSQTQYILLQEKPGNTKSNAQRTSGTKKSAALDSSKDRRNRGAAAPGSCSSWETFNVLPNPPRDPPQGNAPQNKQHPKVSATLVASATISPPTLPATSPNPLRLVCS